MTDEIAVSGNGADGRKIVGSYRVAAEVIRVTLSDGTSTEASVDSTPVPTLRENNSAGTCSEKPPEGG